MIEIKPGDIAIGAPFKIGDKSYYITSFITSDAGYVQIYLKLAEELLDKEVKTR